MIFLEFNFFKKNPKQKQTYMQISSTDLKNRHSERKRVKSIQTYIMQLHIFYTDIHIDANTHTWKQSYTQGEICTKTDTQKQKPAKHIQGPEVHAHLNLQLQTGRHSQMKTLTQRGIDIEGFVLTYKGRLRDADRQTQRKIYICASNIQHADQHI